MLHRGAKTLPHNPFLALLREAKPDIDARVAACMDVEIKRHAQRGVEVAALLSEGRSLSLRGGKRLRAALVLAGAQATEKKVTSWELALQVGLAVELLQSYFLIHDDWMDGDEKRRGGPSVHAALRRRFRSEHLGACGAVLTGDYLVALATRALIQATEKHVRQTELLTTFADMQLAAVLGQQLDAVQITRSADMVYELKTGSYTVSGPLRLGALLSAADSKTLVALERFAQPLGIAFQLRDDQLNLFASSKQTGKPVASDLVAGKWTWLVQWAFAHAKPSARRALKVAFGNASASRAEIKTALAALRESGADEAAEQRIRELSATALSSLKKAKLSPAGDALLRGAARAFVERGA
jgi:geranylgeranyl diphosphate synthase, type I